jgi:hypothetical protein
LTDLTFAVGVQQNLPVKSAFNDSNGDQISINVFGLPSGLVYDNVAGKIRGAVQSAGDFNVTVIASDNNNGLAYKSFALHATAASGGCGGCHGQ